MTLELGGGDGRSVILMSHSGGTMIGHVPIFIPILVDLIQDGIIILIVGGWLPIYAAQSRPPAVHKPFLRFPRNGKAGLVSKQREELKGRRKC